MVSDEPWYVIGQQDYKNTAFKDNVLTHSQARYQIFNQLYQTNKEIQLGGVTTHWLNSALLAKEQIFSQLTKLKTPILVLQAGEDTVVDNLAQNEFCQQLHQLNSDAYPKGKPVIISGAYHELFFEIDEYREQALKHILQWFEDH